MMLLLGLALGSGCEVVHTTECVPGPPGTAGCLDRDSDPNATDTGLTETGGSPLQDTGWPAGDWVAALQWKGLSYDTIQDAISEASDGDTVLVAPGTHRERIDFHGKGIHVRSTHGARATVLDAEGRGSVVTIRAQEPSSAILEGFTITGGQGTDDHGGGVFVENADAVIKHNVFFDNRANVGGGVYLRHGEAMVHNNLILSNFATNGGGGVTCTNCKGGFRYNTLIDNDAVFGPAGEWFFEPQGDLVGNLILVPETVDHAMRYMEDLGYTFAFHHNLLWPEVPWVDEEQPNLVPWPDGEGLVYEQPSFQDADAGDFRLVDGSPGVDAGPEDETDPDGSRADLGAFGGPDGDWSPDLPSHTHARPPWDTGPATE